MAKLEIEVTAEVAEAVRQLNSVGTSITQIEKDTKPAGLSLTDLKSGFELVGDAARMVGEAYDATVGVFVEYAAVVRDVTSATGVQTEEASRLIESSDDAGVSVSALKLAMKTMLKDGVQPSIDSFAALSDEYLAIQDPAQRAQFAMDKFGRSGLEMIKWLEQGGDAMRATSAVMDSEMAVSAEKARVAFDALDDSIRNIKLSVGAQLIPILTEASTALELMVTSGEKYQQAEDNQLRTIALSTMSQKEYIAEVDRLARIRGAGLYQISALTEAEREQLRATEVATQATQQAAIVQVAAADSVGYHKTTIDDYNGSLYEKMEAEKNAGATISMQAENARAAIAAQEALTVAGQTYAAAISGTVKNEVESFNQKQADTAARAKDIQAEIDKLNAKWWLSPDQKQQLADLKQQLDDNTQAVKDNATAHAEASKKIALGYLEQRLAAGGTTQEEQDALMEVAGALGLVDQKGLALYQNIGAAAANFNATGDVRKLAADVAAATVEIDDVSTSMGDVAAAADMNIPKTIAYGADTVRTMMESTRVTNQFKDALYSIPEYKKIVVETVYVSTRSQMEEYRNEDRAAAAAVP